MPGRRTSVRGASIRPSGPLVASAPSSCPMSVGPRMNGLRIIRIFAKTRMRRRIRRATGKFSISCNVLLWSHVGPQPETSDARSRGRNAAIQRLARVAVAGLRQCAYRLGRDSAGMHRHAPPRSSARLVDVEVRPRRAAQPRSERSTGAARPAPRCAVNASGSPRNGPAPRRSLLCAVASSPRSVPGGRPSDGAVSPGGGGPGRPHSRRRARTTRTATARPPGSPTLAAAAEPGRECSHLHPGQRRIRAGPAQFRGHSHRRGPLSGVSACGYFGDPPALGSQTRSAGAGRIH